MNSQVGKGTVWISSSVKSRCYSAAKALFWTQKCFESTISAIFTGEFRPNENKCAMKWAFFDRWLMCQPSHVLNLCVGELFNENYPRHCAYLGADSVSQTPTAFSQFLSLLSSYIYSTHTLLRVRENKTSYDGKTDALKKNSEMHSWSQSACFRGFLSDFNAIWHQSLVEVYLRIARLSVKLEDFHSFLWKSWVGGASWRVLNGLLFKLNTMMM